MFGEGVLEEDDVRGEPRRNEEEEDEEQEFFADHELMNDRVKDLQKQLHPIPSFDSSLANLLIVDGLPEVGPEKKAKLEQVITDEKKFFGTKKYDVRHFLLPTTEEGKTIGAAFFEFGDRNKVDFAIKRYNGFALDKSHRFILCNHQYFEDVEKVPETFQPPPERDFKPLDNLRWWLTDPCALDQFVIRYGNETEILWNEILRRPEPCFKASGMTDSFVVWSSHGSFLATFHQRGVKLWGGEGWSEIHKLPHAGVKLLDFSPSERYLITLAPQVTDDKDPADPKFLIIWDTLSGKKCRGFNKTEAMARTAFKWSSDDKYFARMEKDKIVIYETPSMKVLGKEKLSVPGVKDFAWSPTEHKIVYWTADEDKARVTFREIPSRKEIYSKTLFKVIDVKMHWQSKGKYLAIEVERFTKNKKVTKTSFEIFKVQEKGIPTEILHMNTPVIACAWEPKGDRLAVIHGEKTAHRYNVSFYQVNKKGLKHLITLDNRPANCLFWSPRGSFIALVGLKNFNGAIEFYNVDILETMGEGDHYMATDICWDPTGRYLCSYISSWRHQSENGYILWSFRGEIIHKIQKDRFYQFAWRPRPPTLLSAEQERNIKRNFESYVERYKKEDARESTKFIEEKMAEMHNQRDEFAAFLTKWRQAYQSERDQRAALRGGKYSDDEEDYDTVEEFIEEVVEEKEEIVN